MSSSTPAEQAPAYDDLFEARPATVLGRLSKYTPLATNDHPDPDVESRAHQHDASSSSTPLDNNNTVGGQPHTHCDVCDRQLDRRERRRAQEICCAMVSRTFVLIALFLMIFGVVAVVSARKRKH